MILSQPVRSLARTCHCFLLKCDVAHPVPFRTYNTARRGAARRVVAWRAQLFVLIYIMLVYLLFYIHHFALRRITLLGFINALVRVYNCSFAFSRLNGRTDFDEIRYGDSLNSDAFPDKK